jgi:hypothetical protein
MCPNRSARAKSSERSPLAFPGSGDFGFADLTGIQVVGTVVYNSSGVFGFASSCLQTQDSVRGATGKTFMVGSRNNEMGRYFNGSLSELLVFPRALNATEQALVQAYLLAKWPVPKPLSCSPVRNCSVPAATVSMLNKTQRFAASMRKSGFADAVYELAHALLVLDSAQAWSDRCQGLVNGTISPLPYEPSELAADSAYRQATQTLFTGLQTTILSYLNSPDPRKQLIYSLWASATE